MGKSKRLQQATGGQAGPSPLAVPNRDTILRLNYLHQVSKYLARVTPQTSTPTCQRDELEVPHLIPTQPCQMEQDISQSSCANRTIKLPAPTAVTPPIRRSKRKGRKPAIIRMQRNMAMRLSKDMVGTMRDIGKKATIRMDPSLKREMCKICNTLLIPGVTSSVRIKPSGPHRHLIRHACLACSTAKRLPAPPIIPTKDTQLEEGKTLSKSAKKRLRQAQKLATFHERDIHVTFKGLERVQAGGQA